MNVIDWMKASAEYMAASQPSIFTYETAIAQLSDQMHILRTVYEHQTPAMLMSGGFMLVRMVEAEGMEEFQLLQLISGSATFFPEMSVMVYRGNLDDVDLPHISEAYPSQSSDTGVDGDGEGMVE